MGKESVETKRTSVGAKSPTILISKTNLQKELTKQWSSQHGVVSQLQIVEDGYAVIFIKSPHTDFSIVCRGLANEGNKYNRLAKMFQEKNLISRQERIKSFFIRRAFVWESVDPTKDTFRSGDNVMVIVSKVPTKVKKAIVKPKELKVALKVN